MLVPVIRSGYRRMHPFRRTLVGILRTNDPFGLSMCQNQWLRTPEEDWVILRRPQLPRYAKAISHLVAWANARAPHAPGQPNRPLRFTLADEL